MVGTLGSGQASKPNSSLNSQDGTEEQKSAQTTKVANPKHMINTPIIILIPRDFHTCIFPALEVALLQT